MKWKLKAALQAIIEMLPFSEKINYFLQTKVSRTLPAGAEVLAQKIKFSQQHYDAFKNGGDAIASDAVAYEFGAGYDLTIPIQLSLLGVPHQVVTDIAPLFSFSNFPSRKIMPPELLYEYVYLNTFEDLKERGIVYITPVFPDDTGFADNSFDFIHSTDTLEHIPEKDILPILKECYRILKPGGIISCVIDLQDHYAYFDKSLSPFNFYRYSPKTWEVWYNNRLQFQNRLVAEEYYNFFAGAGFARISQELETADDVQTNRLKVMKLDKKFGAYEVDELNILRCHVTAIKAD